MDRRDWAAYRNADSSDSIEVTRYNNEGEDYTVTLPTVFGVCGTCDGRGKHVNPAIDAHGISSQEFAEDPGFAEEYFSGMYDQTCNECDGRRVVPTVDVAVCNPEQLEAYKYMLDEEEERYEEYILMQRECGYM
jgi:hypothetical protein